MTESVRTVRVQSIAWEATDVFSLYLAAMDSAPLPPFEPGSHINVHLPNGLMRSYSLSRIYSDKGYRITVARDAASTGGSVFLADQLRPGALIGIGAACNNFPLDETANLSVFVAGGIGVTPFVPMAARLNAIARPWRLHYCVRTRERAALLDELQALAAAGAGEVILNVDHEPGGTLLDLAAVIGALAPNDHVYCCGPGGMLDSFRATCRDLTIDDAHVHFEYFKGDVSVAKDGCFDLHLAKSGRILRVEPGKTILETLQREGFDVAFSCEQGVCGACETRVLAGTPDHRDLILSDAERAMGRKMMICCSGSKSPSLTLDI
ncbi:PDR/VanB family oxidoreductase [Paraburkholderia dilworthii]|uniref:PDR/VanB family oxidoreductase n=1 Tax=Paraburkholderia dilworthii TaxID=948106 RepID=UPI00048571F8|nr:PDR/VanB family oxidoreductase [Paraburkholderia dilworthii]